MVENRLDTVPVEQRRSFTRFLKSLASFTGDLSNLTCPSFLLAPESLLEYSSYWVDRPQVLQDSAKGETEEERFYGTLRWFISALNGAFSSRVPKGEWEKKPYNPILGEQFFCSWEDGTHAICEQVCHHPPITAFHVENKASGVSITHNDGQKTRFSGTQLLVDQIGYCMLEMENHGEKYLFSLPSISVNGIWYAAPHVELYGKSYVQSSTGFFATFEYSTKGWISGDRHRFKAEVSSEKLKGLTTIKGQWTTKSIIKRYGEDPEIFIDLTKLDRPSVHVKPISEQTPLESRKIWEKVTESIKSGDYSAASAEKTNIENQQRRLCQERGEEAWKPKYFEESTSSELFGDLKDLIIKNSNNKFIDTFDRKAWKYNKTD